MAKNNKNGSRSLLQRLASGGPNQRGSNRRGTRPRGEGRGLISSVRALLGRNK